MIRRLSRRASVRGLGQRIFQPDPATPGSGSGGKLRTAALTGQEVAVLRLVAGGYSNKEIARHLGMRKLDARDRTHAVLKAISGQMLPRDDAVK
jgi:DNA-binding NarL/FixJ family response regulator